MISCFEPGEMMKPRKQNPRRKAADRVKAVSKTSATPSEAAQIPDPTNAAKT